MGVCPVHPLVMIIESIDSIRRDGPDTPIIILCNSLKTQTCSAGLTRQWEFHLFIVLGMLWREW